MYIGIVKRATFDDFNRAIMSKTSPQIPLPFLKLRRRDAEPLFLQLYSQIREAIFSGQLKEGERLPATRALAAELGISRNSVFQAFEQLILEGFLEGRKGDGTYVCAKISMAPAKPAKAAQEQEEEYLPDCSIEPLLPFQTSIPSLPHFPFRTWARIAADVYRNIHTLHLGYGDTQGYEPLRNELSDYLRINRSIICPPDQILIVSGSRQAINLSAQLLIGKGDQCWMEDPGYKGASDAIKRWGGKLCPVPMTEYGLDIDYAIKKYPAAKFVYVTPSHQYPFGGTLPLSERLKLLQWAARQKMWIVEDDYDSEFRYVGRPVPALKGLDDAGRVIYTGTFSKVLFPALRLGYMVLPSREMARNFRKLKGSIDRENPVIDQAIITQFMREGHFARHLRKMRTLYKKLQDELTALMKMHLHPWLDVESGENGMHLVAWLKHGMDAVAVEKAANEKGLVLQPVDDFSIKYRHKNALMFGFTGYPAEDMEKAVLQLKQILLNLHP
ncbi:MocR-like pyridoxine biosynthesis transcription factor PdxR [Chitinophaga cymbidii]|uniref:GntR family transcriptional regulator n=1 Tax=Chitinophaga cymbidii TaxID=1096750 RepID=A0A512RQ30_9BACT|nr:PLP-dependent aminotransferase family protein [Chitinophaga cymbidii]GEP97794.1 GntR family transcriptional regulator [Chitinophaga cymbidii]